MSINMGTLDRGLRLAVAAILLFLAFGTSVLGSGVLLWLGLIAAVVFTLTAFAGNCPLYSVVGVRTCKKC